MIERRNTPLILVAILLVSILVVAGVVRELRFARLERRYTDLQSRMMDEIRATSATVDRLRRESALDRDASARPPTDSVEKSDEPLAYYRAVDLLIEQFTRHERQAARARLLQSDLFRSATVSANLNTQNHEDSEVLLSRDGRQFFSITVDEDGIEVRSALGASVREQEFGPVSAAFLSAEARRLSSLPPEPSSSVGAESAADEGPATSSEPAPVQDPISDVDRGRLRIERMLADTGFRNLLANRDLTPASEVRESDHFLYYDLLFSGGARLGAFAVQKSTGEVWLVDSEDVIIMSLHRASGTVSVRQPLNVPASMDHSDERTNGGLTVLLLGVNEEVTDSIMLAHVDPPSETIHFFGLPRDLFFRGARINRIYSQYGYERMATEVARITGLRVNHTIAVDMYAFIDVINILGGITIELEEELIDPTYRVRDDGVWSTLYYPPGEHHLDGLAALRIARSRFTTTDFGRARRQQDIINAVRKKIAGMGIGDIATIQTLITRLFDYVETDFTLVDALRTVTRYGRFGNASHHVLSTDNVLFSTWTALHYQGLTEDDVDEDYDRGAWILLPHDDNWELIRWYVRTAIEEGNVDLEWLRIAGYLSDPKL